MFFIVLSHMHSFIYINYFYIVIVSQFPCLSMISMILTWTQYVHMCPGHYLVRGVDVCVQFIWQAIASLL